jgi:hypothetical protein
VPRTHHNTRQLRTSKRGARCIATDRRNICLGARVTRDPFIRVLTMVKKLHTPVSRREACVVTEHAEHIQEVEPLRRIAVNRRFAEAVDKAVASARVAYDFNPGSYTACALSHVVAIQTMLGWLDDLGAK